MAVGHYGSSMRRRVLLVLLVALGVTSSGCAQCRADCAGPEVIIELDDPAAVAIELCQNGICTTKDVAKRDGQSAAWFSVAMDERRRVDVDIATLDRTGSVLVTDTFAGQLPSGDCGCEVGPVALRADEESISTG